MAKLSQYFQFSEKYAELLAYKTFWLQMGQQEKNADGQKEKNADKNKIILHKGVRN